MKMSNTASGPWLFFLFNLPGTRASERVKVWRRLKKFGAIQLKTSAYVLPDEPTHYKRFQWLGKEVVDVGGEATLARVADIEGMPHAAVVSLFNAARSKDYDEALNRSLYLSRIRKLARRILMRSLTSRRNSSSASKKFRPLIIFNVPAVKTSNGSSKKQQLLSRRQKNPRPPNDYRSLIIKASSG
jgi:hypothetical protein